jgi:SP family general alpha glucoside:H+ symporter-like MFS transporter
MRFGVSSSLTVIQSTSSNRGDTMNHSRRVSSLAALQLVVTASSFFLLDLVGRRPLLIFGSGVCAMCCWGLGGLAFAAEPSGKGMVALCCIWISVYSATLNSLGYTFVGEISTQRLKSKTSAISFGVYACLSLIMAYICPYMLSDLEWGWGLKTGK